MVSQKEKDCIRDVLDKCHDSYNKFERLILMTEANSMQKYVNRYPMIRDFLGFNQWLGDSVHFDNEIKSAYAPVIRYILNTVIQNTEYFYLIFKGLEYNLYHQSRTLMRSIFESIPKMYYLVYHPDECKYVILKDIMNGSYGLLKENDQTKYFRNVKTNPYYSSILKDITDGEILKIKWRKEYSITYYLEEVYGIYGNKEHGYLRDVYADLCQSSHPSWFRTTANYTDSDIDKTMHDMCVLAYHNIHAGMEGYGAQDCDGVDFPHDDSFWFLTHMKYELGKNDPFYSMYPTHEDLELKIKYNV